ncbi:MAG: TlyA family RNA methyltransferase [Pseudomonadota bacterium]
MKTRLDEWLVNKGFYPSRARARDAILRGCISLDNNLSAKPSRTVGDDDAVRIDDPALQYVSRAALKLVHGLSETGFSPIGRTALDIGASTGGFCQVLLQLGADHVYALDVGHDQLAPCLRNHPKLTNLEGINARDLRIDHLAGKGPEFLTSDVSFISLKLALPPALEIAAEKAIGVFLVKPQFEVGRVGLGKGGVVRDSHLALETAKSVRNWLDEFPGWKATHFMPSPLPGGDGNQEFLLAGMKHG